MATPVQQNSEIQKMRLLGDSQSLISRINLASEEYSHLSGVTYEEALIHVLIEVRHLCDVNNFEFAALDRKAYRGYADELSWTEVKA